MVITTSIVMPDGSPAKYCRCIGGAGFVCPDHPWRRAKQPGFYRMKWSNVVMHPGVKSVLEARVARRSR